MNKINVKKNFANGRKTKRLGCLLNTGLQLNADQLFMTTAKCLNYKCKYTFDQSVKLIHGLK